MRFTLLIRRCDKKLKCKNGHEFEFPAYITQRVRTPMVTIADVGVDNSRYEITYPVCPICQVSLYSVATPEEVAPPGEIAPKEEIPQAKSRKRKRKPQEEAAVNDAKAQEEE